MNKESNSMNSLGERVFWSGSDDEGNEKEENKCFTNLKNET